MTHLGHLGDGIDAPAVVGHRYQVGGAGQIQIPEIMVNHTRSPVEALRATTESENRFCPSRSPP